MSSRLMFRSVQYPVSSWILNRFLSLTQIQSVAATKLKEKIPSNDEIVLQNKIVNSSTTSTNVSDLNKTYSEKIHRIVDEISKLSLVEVMDLNELLKVKN
jgi:hypothetical protein